MTEFDLDQDTIITRPVSLQLQTITFDPKKNHNHPRFQLFCSHHSSNTFTAAPESSLSEPLNHHLSNIETQSEMRRRGNKSSLIANPSNEQPSPSSSIAITAFRNSDLNASRIETFLDSPIRPDESSPPNHAYLRDGGIPPSPTAAVTTEVITGVTTGLVAGSSIVSDVARRYTPNFSEHKAEIEERRTDMAAPAVVVENKKTETYTPDMSKPTAELPAELYSRLRAAGFTLDPQNRRSEKGREDAVEITPRVMLAAPSPEPGRWREEERILAWSRSGSPLMETEDLLEESVPVDDVATPSNRGSVLEDPPKSVDKGKGEVEVVDFDSVPAPEEAPSPWNVLTEPYDPWSKRQSAVVQVSSKAKGEEKVVSFDPDPVSAEIPSPWLAPTALYTSSSEETSAAEYTSTVAGQRNGRAEVESLYPVPLKKTLSPYSAPTESYASQFRQDAAVVKVYSLANEGKQKGVETEEGSGVAGVEEWRKKVQHPSSNKPGLASYKYETKSSRSKKALPNKTSVGTTVAMRKDIKNELADIEAKEARLIATSFSFTDRQNSPNRGRKQKENGKNLKQQDIQNQVVWERMRKSKEKAAEKLVIPVTRSEVHRNQNSGDFTQNTARSHTPRISGRARRENEGRNIARGTIPRSARTSTFDAPTVSGSSWTLKHPTPILKRPVKKTSLSKPPTIASAQDISDSTRKANSTLHSDSTPFLPSVQQSHNPVGSPAHDGPASRASQRTTIPRLTWVARGSPSTPLNRTVHSQPRGGGAVRTPSKAMENKLDEAIDKHIENNKSKEIKIE
jgi:hypothetical protein